MSKQDGSRRGRYVRWIAISIIAILLLSVAVNTGLAQEGPRVFLPFVNTDGESQLASIWESIELPPIDYMWWESKPGDEIPADQNATPTPLPTSTPTDEEAKLLPTVVIPAQPTAEVIEIDQDVPRQEKYGVIIKRAVTGSQLINYMSPTTEEFLKILDAYNKNDIDTLMKLLDSYVQPGDKFITIGPPYHGGPRPEDTPTAIP